MTEISLLQPFVEAIEACSRREEENLRIALNALAERYPDLIQLSDEAIAARSASKVDAVFQKVKKLFNELEVGADFEIPFLSHIRINSASGRVHIGHGSRSALLFPD